MDNKNIITLIKKYDIENDEKHMIELFKKYPKIVSKYINIYILLTTYPAHGSGNVGDKLITDSFKELIKLIYTKYNKRVYFFELFRENDLTPILQCVNNTKGILMPGFAIRLNMYDSIYKLTPNLDDINIPYIPIGAGEGTFPSTVTNIITNRYNKKTIKFLKYISLHSPAGIGCRDPLVMKQFKYNGINNVEFVGDCAYYDIQMIHKPLKYNGTINTIVFTEPHMSIYKQQVYGIIDLIAKLFPKARKIYSLHSKLNGLRTMYSKYASKYDFEIIQSYSSNKKLDIYKNCDLHIGYRVHGYISFLRYRIPAVLLIEDSRGLGQSYSFNNIGCFKAFVVNSNKMIPDMNLPSKVEKYIKSCITTNFVDYNGAIDIIDNTYNNNMLPFIKKCVSI